MRVLVTGGAGIGSHLVERLLAGGDVVVPDSLEARVHARLNAALQGAGLEDN